eukprot:scaffold79_cov259-Pinguiococcus_pyrenoidosus.AAC.8
MPPSAASSSLLAASTPTPAPRWRGALPLRKRPLLQRTGLRTILGAGGGDCGTSGHAENDVDGASAGCDAGVQLVHLRAERLHLDLGAFFYLKAVQELHEAIHAPSPLFLQETTALVHLDHLQQLLCGSLEIHVSLPQRHAAQVAQLVGHAALQRSPGLRGGDRPPIRRHEEIAAPRVSSAVALRELPPRSLASLRRERAGSGRALEVRTAPRAARTKAWQFEAAKRSAAAEVPVRCACLRLVADAVWLGAKSAQRRSGARGQITLTDPGSAFKQRKSAGSLFSTRPRTSGRGWQLLASEKLHAQCHGGAKLLAHAFATTRLGSARVRASKSPLRVGPTATARGQVRNWERPAHDVQTKYVPLRRHVWLSRRSRVRDWLGRAVAALHTVPNRPRSGCGLPRRSNAGHVHCGEIPNTEQGFLSGPIAERGRVGFRPCLWRPQRAFGGTPGLDKDFTRQDQSSILQNCRGCRSPKKPCMARRSVNLSCWVPLPSAKVFHEFNLQWGSEVESAHIIGDARGPFLKLLGCPSSLLGSQSPGKAEGG